MFSSNVVVFLKPSVDMALCRQEAARDQMASQHRHQHLLVKIVMDINISLPSHVQNDFLMLIGLWKG